MPHYLRWARPPRIRTIGDPRLMRTNAIYRRAVFGTGPFPRSRFLRQFVWRKRRSFTNDEFRVVHIFVVSTTLHIPGFTSGPVTTTAVVGVTTPPGNFYDNVREFGIFFIFSLMSRLRLVFRPGPTRFMLSSKPISRTRYALRTDNNMLCCAAGKTHTGEKPKPTPVRTKVQRVTRVSVLNKNKQKNSRGGLPWHLNKT